MREDIHSEAMLLDNDVPEDVNEPLLGEMGEQSRVVPREEVETMVQAEDEMPIDDGRDKDVHAYLHAITKVVDRGRLLAEKVLVARREEKAREEARLATEKSREEIATRLATQQTAWEAECAVLVAQLEAATQGKSMVEQQLAEAMKEKEVAKVA